MREGVSQSELDEALDDVLASSGADAAELFVREPGGDRLWLAAHRGAAGREFRSRTVFDLGEGYPGIVAQSGEPILTADLGQDRRFLREALKRRGFRCFHCVPLTGADGAVAGSLHLATRRRDPALVGSPRDLQAAARGLAAVLELGQLRAKDAVSRLRSDVDLDAARNLELRLRRALEVMADVTGARGGIALLRDPGTGSLHPWAWTGAYASACSAVARSTPSGCACSVITERSGTVASSGGDGPPRCSVAPAGYSRVACVPLVAGDEVLGAISLGFDAAGEPPGRLLAVLASMAERLASSVADAQIAMTAEQHAVASRDLRLRGDLDALLERELRPVIAELGAGGDARLDAVETVLRTSAREIAAVRSARGADGSPPAAATEVLDVRCFGPLTIFRPGQRIDASHLQRTRAWRLLEILLTRYGAAVDDDQLIEWLWPDGPGRGAAAQLKVLVHDLRRVLAPPSAGPGAPRFIVRSGHGYAFDVRSPHRIDTVDFASLIGWAERLAQLGEVDSAIVAYRAAADLYAGDFLADELYADWCAHEREELREQFFGVLRHTATLLLARGDLDGAIACHRRALHLDESQEGAHRELMRLLWEAGRPDEARRQYAACRQALARSAWRDPQPQTLALAQLMGVPAGA